MNDTQWREKYLIGIAEIDTDHQYLFSVIAMEVSELLLHKDDIQRQFFRKSIEKLVRYIKQHYQNEEEWMKKHHYPHIEAHQDQHALSVQEIEKMAVLLEMHTFKTCMTSYLQVLNNLDRHILEYDKKIGDYYQNSIFQ